MIAEWMLIILVAVLVFNPKKLPELARMLAVFGHHCTQTKNKITAIWEQQLNYQQLKINEEKAQAADKLYQNQDTCSS